MRADVPVVPRSIHATAVAIGGRALLICGPSRAGKSRLALALIARATPTLPIVLIGDDRILLHGAIEGGTGDLVARPHPRTTGFVERRGLGIVAMPWLPQAPVGGIVDLGGGQLQSPGLAPNRSAGVPRLEIAGHHEETARAGLVLGWWADASAASSAASVSIAACASHLPEKADGTFRPCAKD